MIGFAVFICVIPCTYKSIICIIRMIYKARVVSIFTEFTKVIVKIHSQIFSIHLYPELVSLHFEIIYTL